MTFPNFATKILWLLSQLSLASSLDFISFGDNLKTKRAIMFKVFTGLKLFRRDIFVSDIIGENYW